MTAITDTDIGRALGTDYFLLREELGELGLVGDGIEGYGCPAMSMVAAGLVQMEVSRGDGSLGTLIVGRDITGVSAFT